MKVSFSSRWMVAVALISALLAGTLWGRVRPPYKVLFSNDTTNILTCQSPYHQENQPINMHMLDASVDETAGTGINVHMLQPGFTWVPFWQSKVLPVEEHAAWWNETYPNIGISGYLQMVLEGNDFVEQFIERCRQKDLTPFISLRLNDKHLLNEIDAPQGPGRSVHICKFYMDHLDYRIGNDKSDIYQRVHNWAIPEAREYKYRFIEEICENYDIAGLELDFMRHSSFFRLTETTTQEREQIMTAFVRRVRELLDRTSKAGQRRWLCVRVPEHLSCNDALGIDLNAFEQAGVDMFNFSSYYFTDQQGDWQRIQKLIPDTAKYIEVTHCAAIGETIAHAKRNFVTRFTTDEQFYMYCPIYFKNSKSFIRLTFQGNGPHGKVC